MSNIEITKYHELYSEYLQLIVVLNDAHLNFIKHGGLKTSVDLRRCVNQMIEIQKQIRTASQAAAAESRENRKTEIVAKREKIKLTQARNQNGKYSRKHQDAG